VQSCGSPGGWQVGVVGNKAFARLAECRAAVCEIVLKSRGQIKSRRASLDLYKALKAPAAS
jgi:hypothetical protein